MVQDACGLYEIEVAPQHAQFENIGLAIFDIGQSQFLRLSLRIGKAAQAQIDCQHLRIAKAPRHLDRVLSCAAASNQDIDRADGPALEARKRKFPIQVGADAI